MNNKPNNIFFLKDFPRICNKTQTFDKGFPFSITTTLRLGARVFALIAPKTPAAPPPTTTNSSSLDCPLKKTKQLKKPNFFFLCLVAEKKKRGNV